MAVIDDLVVYYPLDEASGDAIDAHGSLDLTEVGTVPSVAGKVGTARDLEDSTGDFFFHADDASYDVGDVDFEMQAWVKLESKPSNTMHIISKGFNYFLRWDNVTDRFQLFVFDGGSFVGVTANNFGAPSTGAWYFIHAWHDSVNNVLGISVNDGTPDTTAHSTGAVADASDFRIGRQSGGSEVFDGVIDEAAFWTRVLTSAQRTWLYNAGSGRSYADIVAEGTTAITLYVNTASAGGDGTTNALSGAQAAFASLRAALVSFGSGTLTAPTTILCEGVAADTLICTQAHWNFETTADNYLVVRGNNRTGKYDTSKYRIESSDTSGIYNNIAGHVWLDAIQVQLTVTTSIGSTFNCFRLATANNQNGPVEHKYSNCIAKMVVSGGATDNITGFMDSDPGSGGTCLRINCIAYGGYVGFGSDSSSWAAADLKNYNCTGYGNDYNFGDAQVCVNCLSAAPSVGPGFNSTGSTGHFNNASDDSSAAGTNARINQTFSFVNAGAGDFHLQNTDAGAKGFGLTDPASGLFDDDIDGQPRSTPWDIGADQTSRRFLLSRF